MQPFKVNRNSWHYKFNMNFFNNHGESNIGREHWESKHNNFCAYWRVTMFRMMWATILSIGAIGFISMIGVGIYNDPIGAVVIFGFVIGTIAAAIGTVYLGNKIKNRKPSDASKSLFVQKYIAYKSKVCPQVTYD
jgi:hypothetical protein